MSIYSTADFQNSIERSIQEGYSIKIGELFSKGWDKVKPHWFHIALIHFVWFIAYTFCSGTIILAPPMLLGPRFIAHKLELGEKPSFSDAFAGFNHFGLSWKLAWKIISKIILYIIPFILGYILIFVGAIMASSNGGDSDAGGVISVIGMVLLLVSIIPMIIRLYYIIIRSFFMTDLALFAGYEVDNAYDTSFALSKGKFWEILIPYYISAVVGGLGMYICGVGMFLTYPFMFQVHKELHHQAYMGNTVPSFE